MRNQLRLIIRQPLLAVAADLAEPVQLCLAPNETGQPASRRRVEPRTQGPGPRQLEDLDRCLEALHGHRPQRLHLDVALGKPQGVGGEEAFAPSCELLHPGCQVRGLANGGVVHVQIAADGADHDLARVEPDTNLKRDALGATCLFGIPANGGLHVEGGVARPDGVILLRERRAEQRHDPIAHHLVHGALVAVDRLHHVFEHGVEELPGLLGIAVGKQLHGGLKVGEQDRDLLALAFQGELGREDLLGLVLGGIGLRGGVARLSRPIHTHRSAALVAEAGPRWQVDPAGHTGQPDSRAAAEAEVRLGRAVMLAPGTLHAGPS